MKITIKKQEIELRYGFRALMIYEQITNESFNVDGLTSVITFFYSVILGSKVGIVLSFDEFMDWLDENPTILNEFSEWLQSVALSKIPSKKAEEEKKVEAKLSK